jgi:hypothetical protein
MKAIWSFPRYYPPQDLPLVYTYYCTQQNSMVWRHLCCPFFTHILRPGVGHTLAHPRSMLIFSVSLPSLKHHSIFHACICASFWDLQFPCHQWISWGLGQIPNSKMSSLFEKLGRDLVKLLPNFRLKIVEVPTQQDGQTTPTEFRIACMNLEYV